MKRIIIDNQRVTGITKNNICKALILNKEFLVCKALVINELYQCTDYQRVTSQAITLPKSNLVKQSLYLLNIF